MYFQHYDSATRNISRSSDKYFKAPMAAPLRFVTCNFDKMFVAAKGHSQPFYLGVYSSQSIPRRIFYETCREHQHWFIQTR